MGKCPPGVICIENMTVTFIIIIVLIIMYLLYNYMSNNRSQGSEYVLNISNTNPENTNNRGLYPRPGYSFSNIENDVLLNPYQAPLRDNRVFPNTNYTNRIPINVATQ